MPTPREKLDALADTLPPDIRDAFLASIQDIVDNVVLADLIAAIEAGDAARAFQILGMDEAAFRPLSAAIEQAYETGGVAMGATFPAKLNTPYGRAVFRFNVRNPRAEKWLKDESSTLITRVTEDARINVQNALVEGMRTGRNPRNVALDIVGRVDPGTKRRVGGLVGLTVNQEGWVRSARNKLENLDESYFDLKLRDKRFDRTVQAAIDSGQPLNKETVDKLVTRYKDNALRKRGEDIGRTEALHALNASEYEATLQAVDMGAMKEQAVQREWDSAGDRRVRWSHRQLDGERVGLREPFVSPSGARMMHPGDTTLDAPAKEVVACRCRVRTVVDWFKGVT